MITGFTCAAAGATFTAVEIDHLFTFIKEYLTNVTSLVGGVVVIENTATTFQFGPCGTTPGNDPDDTPYTKMVLVTDVQNSYSQIHAQVYVAQADGVMGADATVAYDKESYDSPSYHLSTFDSSVHFACNPLEGWWWIAAHKGTPENGGGHITVCTPFTRVAADMTQGVHSRFGLIQGFANYKDIRVKLPYTTSRLNGKWSGTIKNNNTYLASPYGIGGATRQAGSSLPRGIAPVYPVAAAFENGTWNPTMAAAVFGDARCAMMATDGYTWGEEAAPGWRVFGKTYTEDPPTTIYNQYMALRSPATFDVLSAT